MHPEPLDTYQHVTDTFDLPAASLLESAGGRWDASRCAYLLAVDVSALLVPLGIAHEDGQPSDSPIIHTAIRPLANVIAMVHDAQRGDVLRLRSWFTSPHVSLKGATPLELLLNPNEAPWIEQWVAGFWLGQTG